MVVCTLGMSGFLDLFGGRLLWGRMIFLTWVGEIGNERQVMVGIEGR